MGLPITTKKSVASAFQQISWSRCGTVGGTKNNFLTNDGRNY